MISSSKIYNKINSNIFLEHLQTSVIFKYQEQNKKVKLYCTKYYAFIQRLIRHI